MADTGKLQVRAYDGRSYLPVAGASVVITNTSAAEGTEGREYTFTTDAEGRTPQVDITTPSLERSLNEDNQLIPYALVDVRVNAEGYDELSIKGVQVLPTQIALQVCNLLSSSVGRETQANPPEFELQEDIDIPPNVQFGDYPSKIPEEVDKPLPKPPSGLVVLPEPVIPEYIIVHAGVPTDPSAPNYKVDYTDYLKNVASSEIYATWPEATIRANVYAINSFTLNRIYTEWYRGKGYDFDITNSTAYDQAFVYGRNIFESISVIVDEIFSTYVRRPGAKQPLFTQYCDGRYVACPGWMTQWGSKTLGEQGLGPYDILATYYGNDLELTTAQKVSGSPKSYPGYILELGSSGDPVKTTQEFLNRIAQNYPLIGKVAVDGVYGQASSDQVRKFQQTFNLPQTGQVDYATWYKISAIYVGVTKIAELRDGETDRQLTREEIEYFSPPTPYSDAVDVPKIGYLK